MANSTSTSGEGELHCKHCGCVFQILLSASSNLFCPQCGASLNENEPEKPIRKATTGKRLTNKEKERLRIARQQRFGAQDSSLPQKRTDNDSDTDLLDRTIQEIVDAEDKQMPLFDEQIVQSLKGSGINVSRRTVAKIREKLGIPTASERRNAG